MIKILNQLPDNDSLNRAIIFLNNQLEYHQSNYNTIQNCSKQNLPRHLESFAQSYHTIYDNEIQNLMQIIQSNETQFVEVEREYNDFCQQKATIWSNSFDAGGHNNSFTYKISKKLIRFFFNSSIRSLLSLNLFKLSTIFNFSA